MKSVLISVQPYWVFLIIAKKMGWNIDKEKTVEVRKNRPKDENWDKIAKIYCSKDKKSFAKIPKEYQPFMEQFLGKVIGEFVCDDIKMSFVGYDEKGCPSYWDILDGTCLTANELVCYGKWKTLYAWHISDLVIYEQPKELSEFSAYEKTKCPAYLNGVCVEKNHRLALYFRCENLDCQYKKLTRPPQSWCYVEGVAGK